MSKDDITRFSACIKYRTTGGAHMEVKAASHGHGRPDTNPGKALQGVVHELARIAAICDMPVEDVLSEVTDAYEAVAESRKDQRLLDLVETEV